MGRPADRVEASRSLQAQQTRKDLARVVSSLFEKWQLGDEEQLTLLGIELQSRHVLTLYLRGELALPDNSEMVDRVSYLLAIHAGLRLLFPEDEETRFGWVKMRNQALGRQTPLEVTCRDSFIGIRRVARSVDSLRWQ